MEEPKIIEVVKSFFAIFNIKVINKIIFSYTDQFIFPVENFSLQKYFKISMNKLEQWTIDYKDFIIGIKTGSDTEEKIIIRIIGLPAEKNTEYKIQLQQI